jgi:ABC-type Zn uptake system ZnuABC Zn-binding protein ZnuA
MGRHLLLALALIACSGALAACGQGTASGGRLRVVATTTQVGDFVRQVGGRRVDVHQILRPNSDPHEYEPRPSDAKELTRAKLVFQSGGDLDQWLDGLIRSAGAGYKVIRLIDSVKTIKRGGRTDPHWWQDPRDAVLAVGAIRRALIRADPGGRALYTRNAGAYVARLRRLDAQIAVCMRRVPAAQRKLVTTHDALGYFADRYHARIIGALIPSLSSQAQPSARDTERLVRQIRRTGVKAIFPERSLNPRLEHAVSSEAGAKVGGALWADTLGPKGSTAATYLQAMAANTSTMVSGMTGGAVSCRPRP